MTISLFGKRYIDARDFCSELNRVRALGEYAWPHELERLEEQRLVIPKIRTVYPPAIYRRLLIDGNLGSRKMQGTVAKNSDELDAAVAFENARERHNHRHIYGPMRHPLDEPEDRFLPFIEVPSSRTFKPWRDYRVDVSTDDDPELWDDGNVVHYYHSWQILLAAETANMGVLIRLNLESSEMHDVVVNAMRTQTPLPFPPSTFSLDAIRMVREFRAHENLLDALSQYIEQARDGLQEIAKHKYGRFILDGTESSRLRKMEKDAARSACERHKLGKADVGALCAFLLGRSVYWARNDRTLLADEYKRYLREAIDLATDGTGQTVDELRALSGPGFGYYEFALDRVFPDWDTHEINRARKALQAAFAKRQEALDRATIDSFLSFVDEQRIHSFFWHLRSFEEHAFHGNSRALSAMQSHLQGMSIVIEHVCRALGSHKGQLYEQFKELWRGTHIETQLRSPENSGRARSNSHRGTDWPQFLSQMDEFSSVGGDNEILSDLMLAYRLRGGVHHEIRGLNQFQLESAFVALMRSAAYTFRHVRHRENHSTEGNQG